VIAPRPVLTAAARKDIAEAQDWYRRESPALAASFREELDRQLARVLRHPAQFPFARALSFKAESLKGIPKGHEH
jgi:plasmid stabilization system protein ParE